MQLFTGLGGKLPADLAITQMCSAAQEHSGRTQMHARPFFPPFASVFHVFRRRRGFAGELESEAKLRHTCKHKHARRRTRPLADLSQLIKRSL